MQTCTKCGAPLSRLDAQCSFCNAPNPRRASIAPEVEGLVARGQEAYQRGRPGEAVELLARAVTLEPEAFDAYFTLAAAWNDLGNLERGVESMERARTIRPGNAPIHYNLGTFFRRLGRRARARACLCEAARLLSYDLVGPHKQQFLDTIRGELTQLGPVTADELAELELRRDAQGHPENPELSRCVHELAGPVSTGAALRFYAAMLRAFLLVPDGGSDGARDGVLKVANTKQELRVALVTGPDGRPWFPAFTDAPALSAFRGNAAAPYTALPAAVIAGMILGDPSTAGLVLNPGPSGGRPVERHGVEAISQGAWPRLTI
ncbi:MAG TPA: SseB family protein [Polyangiaceae bacterium]